MTRTPCGHERSQEEQEDAGDGEGAAQSDLWARTEERGPSKKYKDHKDLQKASRDIQSQELTVNSQQLTSNIQHSPLSIHQSPVTSHQSLVNSQEDKLRGQRGSGHT